MIKELWALLLLSFTGHILSEVTVLKSLQVIYDRSPKLRIRGDGFEAADHDIILELGAVNQPLIMGKDYMVTKGDDNDGIILKLLSNKRFVINCIKMTL